MNQECLKILSDSVVCEMLKQAWEDSEPGISGGHEEGGFIIRTATGKLGVVRWLRGNQNSILVPSHPRCKIGESDVVESFHTHPNTGETYLQEPSETDKRAVKHDPDLKGDLYVGEFVISQAAIYWISPDGQVDKIGARSLLLN
jgi:hypothetical protein